MPICPKTILNQGGVISIIAFLTLGVLLLLGSYFLIFTLTESKISKSQQVGSQIYCLAEAGINEALWKLKNDDTTADGDAAWANDFIDSDKNPYPGGGYWSATFFRSDVLGGSYTVTIQNTARARGRIISTATTTFAGEKVAQRIVKTIVFKSLASPVSESAVFSGGTSENIDLNFTYLKIDKGNLFSNNNLNISGGSQVKVYDNLETSEILEGQVKAVQNLALTGGSEIVTSTAQCAKNTCTEMCAGYTPGSESCPPDSVSVPVVDFDSSDPTSFKSRAQTAQDANECQVLCQKAGQSQYQCSTKCIFTSSEFENLLWEVGEDGTLTLNNAITYVAGSIELRGGRRLVVNGSLVADDNIAIGERYSWTKGGQKDEGFSQITINRPGPTSPSGLLAKRKINFGSYSSFQEINMVGVIYANDEIKIISVPQTFNILGGLIARKLSLTSVWQWLNVTLDNEIILYGLGYIIDGQPVTPSYSPIITVEHWEESY